MTINPFYQLIFNYSIGIKKSKVPKIKGICRRIYTKIAELHRKKKKNNIYVEFKRGRNTLLVNTTHEIPFVLTQNKLYSTNLVRICKYVSANYPDFRVVDIGANIGDSVFLIKEVIDCPILAIEGNPEYIDILSENISQYSNVEKELCLVGSENEVVAVKPVSDGLGTTFFVKDKSLSNTNFQFRSLKSIIEKHSTFEKFKLIKIDTDGFDCSIIKGNMQFLCSFMPIIFFEYAPPWLQNGKDSEIDIFSLLAKNGYNHFIIYDGKGELLYSFSVNENLSLNIKLAHEYLARGRRFGDIVAFPDSDRDIYSETLKQELQFMRFYFNQSLC